MATQLAARDQQYKLITYVCGNACTRQLDNIGTLNFTRIFTSRPSDCRYAVVAIWNVQRQAEDIEVYDLYEVLEHPRTGKLIAPAPIWQGEDADAAIMATMMRYEDG